MASNKKLRRTESDSEHEDDPREEGYGVEEDVDKKAEDVDKKVEEETAWLKKLPKTSEEVEEKPAWLEEMTKRSEDIEKETARIDEMLKKSEEERKMRKGYEEERKRYREERKRYEEARKPKECNPLSFSNQSVLMKKDIPWINELSDFLSSLFDLDFPQIINQSFEQIRLLGYRSWPDYFIPILEAATKTSISLIEAAPEKVGDVLENKENRLRSVINLSPRVVINARGFSDAGYREELKTAVDDFNEAVVRLQQLFLK